MSNLANRLKGGALLVVEPVVFTYDAFTGGFKIFGAALTRTSYNSAKDAKRISERISRNYDFLRYGEIKN